MSGLKIAAPIFYSIQQILQFVKVLWISACWNGAQRNGIRLISSASVEPVGIHDLEFAQDFAPVSQRYCPFLSYLMRCKIQSLQERCIARKYASLLVQSAIAAVKALDGIGGINDLSDIG